MPINSITQTISAIPNPPHRGVDVQTIFVNKQEDFQDHLTDTTVTELNTLKDQLNSRIVEINSTTTTMNGYASTASAGASTATTKAGEASISASEALSYKNQAETFKNNAAASATKASQWADNNYNVEVETGKYSAKHWSIVAQNATVDKLDKDFSILIDKTTPDDTDILAIRETVGVLKKLSWANVKVSLKTYFDSLYMTLTGNQTIAGNKSFTGNLLMIGASSVIGYGTGNGGSVTQLTSKATSVTLNKSSGQIIMNNASLAPGAIVQFNLSNSLVSPTDNIELTLRQSSSVVPVLIELTWAVENGLVQIGIRNNHVVALGEALVLNYSIIKGANS